MSHIKVDPNLLFLEEEVVYWINFLYKNSPKEGDYYISDQEFLRDVIGITSMCTNHNLDAHEIVKSIVDISWSINHKINSLSDLIGPNDIEYWRDHVGNGNPLGLDPRDESSNLSDPTILR